MSNVIWLDYKELAAKHTDSQQLPSLRDQVSAQAQLHEEEIARYLDTSPSYSGLGTIVGDALDPSANVALFPGRRTDGVYVWPAELGYYVRKYHLRLPEGLIQRMAALNWMPPAKEDVDWRAIANSREPRRRR